MEWSGVEWNGMECSCPIRVWDLPTYAQEMVYDYHTVRYLYLSDTLPPGKYNQA